MLHSSIIMAQRDRHLNTALPLVNCLKLVRGFAVWFIGPEVCVECMCGLCVVPYWCLQCSAVAYALVSGHLAAMCVRSIQASGRFGIVRLRQPVPLTRSLVGWLRPFAWAYLAT